MFPNEIKCFGATFAQANERLNIEPLIAGGSGTSDNFNKWYIAERTNGVCKGFSLWLGVGDF